MPERQSHHNCSCNRERRQRWVEPSILYTLWNGPKHGYEIMSALPELGFVQGTADPGAIYRTLRAMEEHNFVKSEWDTSGSGPAKRTYTLTEEGREHMSCWLDALKQRRDALDSFIRRVEKITL
ncbi:PadR family transcriptional regulator [candidate division KSB1 bacterium]|nr:helix-turn-helix transcriptional regulator [candidate division KSB1 bacterium]RQW00316.1 MAG: PadR family transcriptional regulator [candidate division KSB1 bacterium]